MGKIQDHRYSQMWKFLRRGWTLQRVGEHYGITRQGVFYITGKTFRPTGKRTK